jgi:hypothetical protein
MERAVTPESAETLAFQAFAWLSDAMLLKRFLDSAGVSPFAVPALMEDPHFLGGVLDFLLSNDDWVRDFCAAGGLPPTLPLEARRSLPGGEEVHWT